MYTYEDLVAALQSGKTVDDIAAQMSRDLNAAKAEVDRQAAEKAEETKRANELAQKRQVITNLYAAIGQYLTAFHPNSAIGQMYIASDDPSEEDLNHLAEQLDSLVETFEAMAALTNLLGDNPALANMFGEAHIPEITHQNATPNINPLEDFLNKHVRKYTS